MSQQQNDERKMEKIRRMLDNPGNALSNDDKYLSTLQKRLTNDPSYQPSQLQDRSGSKDLTPSVVIHHQKSFSVPLLKPSVSPIVVREKPKEVQLVFDDEDLFEIERIDDTFIPEFVEVKPSKEKIGPVSDTPKDLTVSQSNEHLEILPQWQPVEEEEIQTKSLSKMDDEESVKPKRRTKFLKSFKGSVVRQSAKGPEIWEGEDTKEHQSKTTDAPSWETVDDTANRKKASRKTSKKSVFSRVDETSFEKEDNGTFQPQQKQSISDGFIEMKAPGPQDTNQSPYPYAGYKLYRKHLRIGGKEIRTVHFFSKDVPEDSEPALLPDGYTVQVNEKTGVPYIKKIR
jgi:hypothetical protein